MSYFSFVLLRPFLCAALAKLWKVQFRKGLHKFNNVDSKTAYFNENCYIYICVYVYIYIYICMHMYICVCIYIYIHMLIMCFSSYLFDDL